MRYMLESPHGRWSEDGSRFIYDVEKVAHACGYTVAEVKAYGVLYCRTFRRIIGAAMPSLRPSTAR